MRIVRVKRAGIDDGSLLMRIGLGDAVDGSQIGE